MTSIPNTDPILWTTRKAISALFPYAVRLAQDRQPGMINAILRIASNSTSRGFVWEAVRSYGTTSDVVHHIRGLGEIEILKSYFLLVWSEQCSICSFGFAPVETTVREEFRGIAMWRHREDLTERLGYVLGQLDRGLEHFQQHSPQIKEADIAKRRRQYGRLKKALAELDREAMKTLSRTPPNLVHFNK